MRLIDFAGAPVDATVVYLPEGYTAVVKDGTKYYVYAGVYYVPYYEEGEVIYKVVKL